MNTNKLFEITELIISCNETKISVNDRKINAMIVVKS